ALANGVSGPNGLYRYAAASAFPNQSFNSANYWVDVRFSPSNPVADAAWSGSPAASAGADQPERFTSSALRTPPAGSGFVDDHGGSLTADQGQAVRAAVAEFNLGWHSGPGLHLVETGDVAGAQIVIRASAAGSAGGRPQGVLAITDFSDFTVAGSQGGAEF